MAVGQSTLERVRLYVLQDKNDTELDDLLTAIIEDVTTSLFVYLERYSTNATERKAFIADNQYVVVETSIIRYNRLGSEGYTAESVDGHSMNFLQGNEFGRYSDAFSRYFEGLGHSYKGGIRYW